MLAFTCIELLINECCKPVVCLHQLYGMFAWTFIVISMFVHVLCLTGEDIVFMATDVELLGNVDWVMLQSCFDAHFLLVLEKQDSYNDSVPIFCAVVQLIGTSKQTDNFIYRYLQLFFIVLQLVTSSQ